MAFRSDISDGSGTFLIHHLHALTLTRLDALFVVGAGSGGHRRADLRHWGRAADHLEVVRLPDRVQPAVAIVLLVIFGPVSTRLLTTLESATG